MFKTKTHFMNKFVMICINAAAFLIIQTTYGQETKSSIDYMAPGIYLIFTNKEGVEEMRKPMGKDVTISYLSD